MPTMQHDCGQRIWVDFLKEMGRKPRPRFLKDGRPLTHCPLCQLNLFAEFRAGRLTRPECDNGKE